VDTPWPKQTVVAVPSNPAIKRRREVSIGKVQSDDANTIPYLKTSFTIAERRLNDMHAAETAIVKFNRSATAEGIKKTTMSY
jgi:hypothetical protein